jgi:hypothetical protein
MKTFLTKVLILLAFVVISCDKAVLPEEYDPNTEVSQAREWIDGKWKLTAVFAMIPNPPVPNVQLVISNNKISVIEDGQQIDQVEFELVQTLYSLQLKTTTQPKETNFYVGNSTLKISKDKLFLDRGMPVDLPGYEFLRVN